MFDDHAESLNFWPAFADSMLAVVLVLLLVLGAAYLAPGERMRRAQNCESQFASGVGGTSHGGRTWDVLGAHGETVFTLKQDANDHLLLRLTFDNSVLGFEDCKDTLVDAGQRALARIAEQIRRQSTAIVEIQILGHADWRRPKNCPNNQDNLHLASARADQVFQVLQKNGISPVRYAMSAVSYGEYFPESRRMGQPYSQEDWEKANGTSENMRRNRRVELILRYGTSMQGCQVSK